jgi:small subunit ribosomal protein S9
MTTLNVTPLNAPAGISAAPLSTPAAPIARKLKDAVPADKAGFWWGTGRRKAAVARVRIRLAKSGNGSFTIDSPGAKESRPVDKFFAEDRDRADATAPLKVTGLEGKFDVFVKCHGGGYMGQAGAVKLGLARAIVAYDPNAEAALRNAGFLTRDAREVERKKYGQAGARRRFQFSKR